MFFLHFFKQIFLLLKLVRGKDSIYIKEDFLIWRFDFLLIAWYPDPFLVFMSVSSSFLSQEAMQTTVPH